MKRRRDAREDDEPTTPKRRPLWLRWFLRLAVLGLVLGLLAVAGLVGVFWYYGRDVELPRISTIRDYQPLMVTRIYDRARVLVGEISAERRTVVPYQRIPRQMIQAVVAAEDAEFFNHRGLNYFGMLRALYANLRAGRFVQGGSSITQQVVKTFFLSSERTARRKVQEVLLARRLETELGKEEILYLYLNQIYYGHGRYGVQEASRFFFGKDVDKLSTGEIGLLAGLPQSPERLSPFKHPEAAKRRQTYVLARMAKLGVISAAEARKLTDAPIRVVRNQQPYLNEAPEFTDLVRGELVRTFGEKKVATMGLQVHTTLDAQLQLAAREAVRWGLTALDGRQGFRRAMARLKGKRLTQTLARLRAKQAVIHEGKRYQAIVTAVDDEADRLEIDLGGGKGKVPLQDDARYNPLHLAASQRFAPGDLIVVRAESEELFHFDGGPQAALVAMDPQTGDVLALVGGYDFHPGSYNRATLAARQPGSSFKPFIYAAALDSGRWTPATVLIDEPVRFGNWEPRNYEGEYRGPVRLRQALAHSINTVTAKVLSEVTVEPVRKLAAQMGITTPLGKDLTLALGTSEVRPIDLAVAYSALANGGKRVEPQYILRLGSQELKRAEPRPVLRPEVAYVLTSMMQSVIQEGTARRALRLSRSMAGKTGTTNELKDAWFAGFTPQLVAVVWIGFDDPRPLGRHETGGQAALPIWLRFMQKALRGKPKLPFKQPPNVTTQRIDPESGLLAPDGSTDYVEEVFVSGTEPKETARKPEPASQPAPPAAPPPAPAPAPTKERARVGPPPVGPTPGVQPRSSIPVKPGTP
jgi:penicillin-binding protein 1A